MPSPEGTGAHLLGVAILHPEHRLGAAHDGRQVVAALLEGEAALRHKPARKGRLVSACARAF